MNSLEEKEFRIFIFVAIGCYVASGFFGTLWLSDEFDDIRWAMYTVVTVPATTVFFSFWAFVDGWWRKWPRVFWMLFLTMILTASWGNFLLLNAIDDNQETLVSQTLEERAVNMAYFRGGFGWLYRKRW